MNAREWLDAFATKLGVEPVAQDEFSLLLDLAGAAAHASERVAAPVACWLTARAGMDPGSALKLAREVNGDG
jgi:hypothetical protein